METIERDYSPKGVEFIYIYKALAHPEWDHYVKPFTLEERLLHVAEAKRRLGTRFTWLADGMDNELSAAFGRIPNAEFVIGPDGKVVRRRIWSDPEELRKDLTELVGPVESPTRVEDLDLPTEPPPGKIARGIVPRVEVPGSMRALRIEPRLEGAKHPFFVKLRAEVERDFFGDDDDEDGDGDGKDGGEGKLYLGFHLDPIHHVHWNNLAKPLEYRMRAPDGVTVAPLEGKSPKVEEEADADPREFLVDLSGEEGGGPLELDVYYYACDDDDRWCVPVEQSYLVHLEFDPFGGSVFERARRPGGRERQTRMDPAERFQRMDANADGRLSRDEMPEMMRGFFSDMDANGDGAVDLEEMKARMERMRGQGGPGGPRRPRQGQSAGTGESR